MENTTIAIARTLFLKKIPFCIYRFPFEKELRIAIESNFLSHSKTTDFWMAPFCKQSNATNIHLSVVYKDFLTTDFLNQLQTIPKQEFLLKKLPEGTSKAEYIQSFNAYLDEIKSGEIVKAVLSRVVQIEKPKELDEVGLFSKLSISYPETFTYLALHPKCGIWMGASPELLLKKRGEAIQIMALAGTQKRKDSGEYHWRNKEMEEHEMVGMHIESVFERNNMSLQRKNGPHTIETGRVAHLQTDYTFKENETIALNTLLQEIHPTPAVGGLPAGKGLACVLKNENYDRRYYAGFIGETNFSTSTDLYINLRCMQIGENKIAVFVGGGLTAASDAEEEWQETNFKSQTLISKISTFDSEDGIHQA